MGIRVPNHIKVTFRGPLGTNTGEQWSISLTYEDQASQVGAAAAGANDVNLTACNVAIQNYLGAVSSNAVGISDIRAYHVCWDDAKSKMLAKDAIKKLATSGTIGSATTAVPYQVALVVTKVGANRGPGHLGRWFIPCPRYSIVNTDGQYSLTDVNAALTASTTFAKAVSACIDLPESLESADMVTVSGVGGPSKQSVDHLEIGRRPDILHSRGNKVLDTRTVGAHIDW